MTAENRVNIPSLPNQRRCDSIAILLQGDAVCAAACFTGKQLLLANNLGEPTELVTLVVAYLKKVAQKFSEKTPQKKLWKEINFLKTSLLLYMSTHVRLFQTSKTYAKRYRIALGKVTRSIKLAYRNSEDPSAFEFKLAEIIRKGEAVFLKKPAHMGNNRLPHAELQIIDHIYFNQQSLLTSAVSLYLGISKKCCSNCEGAIAAINSIRKNKIITVRGDGHGFGFAGGIPRFLNENALIKAAFLSQKGKKTLEEIFSTKDAGKMSGEKQLLSPSSSVCESTSVQDSDSQKDQDSVPSAEEVDSESSEYSIPLVPNSSLKIMQKLNDSPQVPMLTPPRSPQKIQPAKKPVKKPKQNPQQKKYQPKPQKATLSAPAVLFPAKKNPRKNPKPVQVVKPAVPGSFL